MRVPWPGPAAPLHGPDPAAVAGALPRAELAFGLVAVVEGDQDVMAFVGGVGAVVLVAGWEVHVVRVAGATDVGLGRSR